MAVATSTALLIGAGLSAGFSGYSAYEQHHDARKARNEQDALEAQRRKELADEAAVRAAAREKATTTGRRVGNMTGRTSFTQALGFGSGNTAGGLGKGQLFGL